MHKTEFSQALPPLRAGMLTLLLTVAMICLAVLSVLSLETAQADLRLADRAALGLTQTVEADNRGQEFLAQLDKTLDVGGSPADLGAVADENGGWNIQLDCGEAGSLSIGFVLEAGRQDRFCHPDRSGIGFYVMHSHKRIFFHNRHHGCHHRAFFPLIRRKIQRKSDKRFPGSSQKQRISQRMETFHIMNGFQIHGAVFAKSHAGIQDDLIPGNPRFPGNPDTLCRFLQDVRVKILILRLIFIVHQAAGDPCPGDQARHLRIIFQSPDIIDQVGACLNRGFGHFRLISIHGHRYIKAGFYRPDHRRHPINLFFI